MMRRRRIGLILGAVSLPVLLAIAAVVGVLLVRSGGLAPFRVPAGEAPPPPGSAEAIARGRYLATLGNCAGCHTAAGGAPFAGGHAFRTAYGTVFSSNITPDPTHGIGAWSRAAFRHAMRHGVSRDGVLSPVFPYTSFRHLTDDDLDAILAYLRDVPPSATPRVASTFEFPANLPGAMTAWRLLYVRPDTAPVIADATIARGAYLVEGIGHCATCHASRGAFASPAEGRALAGARNAGWFAPPLDAGSLARFAAGDVARYLHGDAPRAVGSYGLMADVIAGNLRFLAPADATAIEAYLRALPPPPAPAAPHTVTASAAMLARGRDVYAQHCADCHGDDGAGDGERYPSLRDASAVVARDPINLTKLVLFGAVAPSTPSNPMPYTMPPAAQSLSADDVAAVVNFLRAQANAAAMPVTADDVRALGGIATP